MRDHLGSSSPYRRAVRSWFGRLWHSHRAEIMAGCAFGAAVLVVALIWPITDLIAAHDTHRSPQ